MKVLVPLATGFEEVEALTTVDILRRAGVEVTTAGLQEGLVSGMHGVKVVPDTSIDKVRAVDFDAIAIPGGNPGHINLGNDERVLKLVQEMEKAGGYVTAICGGVSVLSRAGVLKGKKATMHPASANRAEVMKGAHFSEERVVVDGKVITSQGPGTAIEYALKLLEVLAGKKKMKETSGTLLAKL